MAWPFLWYLCCPFHLFHFCFMDGCAERCLRYSSFLLTVVQPSFSLLSGDSLATLLGAVKPQVSVQLPLFFARLFVFPNTLSSVSFRFFCLLFVRKSGELALRQSKTVFHSSFCLFPIVIFFQVTPFFFSLFLHLQTW